MSYARILAAGFSLSILVGACSRAPAPQGAAAGLVAKDGSCSFGAEGHCDEYTEKLAGGMAQTLCSFKHGSYDKTKACPTDKLLGTCSKKGGTKELYYGDNVLNMLASDAKRSCEVEGSQAVWTDGPAAAQFTTIRLIDSAKVVASCAPASGRGSCTEYTTSDAGFRKSACEMIKDVWSTAPCPRENLAASCATGGGDTKHYYRGGAVDILDTHKAACEKTFLGKKGYWIPSAKTVAATTPPPSAREGSSAPGRPQRATRPKKSS
jgi:hypothetical protein